MEVRDFQKQFHVFVGTSCRNIFIIKNKEIFLQENGITESYKSLQ